MHCIYYFLANHRLTELQLLYMYLESAVRFWHCNWTKLAFIDLKCCSFQSEFKYLPVKTKNGSVCLWCLSGLFGSLLKALTVESSKWIVQHKPILSNYFSFASQYGHCVVDCKVTLTRDNRIISYHFKPQQITCFITILFLLCLSQRPYCQGREWVIPFIQRCRIQGQLLSSHRSDFKESCCDN